MLAESSIEVVDSLADIPADEWNALADGNPFVSHQFLSAMHETACASRKTGWRPYYLVLRKDGRFAGAMPLYLKSHSRGEYVFDQGWAEAFERHGIAYYPKLLSAVPFTPVGGPRLLAANHDDRVLLAQAAVELTKQLDVSSLHVLFPQPEDIAALREAGYMLREGVQFHWQDEGYATFDAFLASMSHDKRKKIRQDRKKVEQAGISFRHLRGKEISADHLAFFYRCYESTYISHWSSPYLTPEFFQSISQSLPDSMMLVLAERLDEPVACALNVVGGATMYGRYWGSTEFVSGLHFETCYLQSIQYCIANGIGRFEGGAQGVHKMSRGLLPTATWSAHWVADSRFAEAIADFLARETDGMNRYLDELEAHTPFKEGH
jgi:predicted N-acyltransferase